jgi:hypothetical protein
MKKSTLFIVGLLILVMSCKDNNDNVVESDELLCINENIDKPLSVADVKKYIYGEWKLVGLITMLPSKEVPDIKVVFKDVLGAPIDKQIAEYYEDGKLVGSTLYSLKQDGATIVNIVSDSQTFDNDKYNFFRGIVRICKDELMIDNGIAFDAAGYLFRKL